MRQPAAMPVRSGWTTSAGVEPLVEVAAAAEDEDPPAGDGDGPGLGPVPAGRVAAGRRAGCRAGRASRLPPRISAAPESPLPRTTSTSWWSIPRRRASSRALLRRPVGGVLHGAMVEGDPAAAA